MMRGIAKYAGIITSVFFFGKSLPLTSFFISGNNFLIRRKKLNDSSNKRKLLSWQGNGKLPDFWKEVKNSCHK
jgi:hypothetical protein